MEVEVQEEGRRKNVNETEHDIENDSFSLEESVLRAIGFGYPGASHSNSAGIGDSHVYAWMFAQPTCLCIYMICVGCSFRHPCA